MSFRQTNHPAPTSAGAPAATQAPAETPAAQGTILAARNLTVTYPNTDRAALDHVDLDIAAGRSLAITGASGSGKTTLLHTLAGIMLPTSGTVTYTAPSGAVEVSALSDNERSALRREQFGFVFQQGLLLDELTALENVAVARMLVGIPRSQAETEAREWLAAIGLEGMEDRRLGQLSGGQAQRVAIARAQSTGARLIFADEPTGSLDSATGAEVMDTLLSLGQSGRTLVLITHDENLAARCDRVVTMRDGRIVHDTDQEPSPIVAPLAESVIGGFDAAPPATSVAARTSVVPSFTADALAFAQHAEVAR